MALRLLVIGASVCVGLDLGTDLVLEAVLEVEVVEALSLWTEVFLVVDRPRFVFTCCLLEASVEEGTTVVVLEEAAEGAEEPVLAVC